MLYHTAVAIPALYPVTLSRGLWSCEYNAVIHQLGAKVLWLPTLASYIVTG